MPVTYNYPAAVPEVFDYKASVRAATTAALAANTRTGNRLTADANGVLAAVDGVTLVVNNRVLVKDEVTAANNGIYVVTSVGAAGAQWILDRAADADVSDDVTSGLTVPIAEGTSNGDQTWVLTTNDPITLNTTAMTFGLGAGDITAVNTTAPITGGATSGAVTLALTTSPTGQTPVGVTRLINTTAPVTGGGDLSADRTIALTTSPIGQTPVGVTRLINTTAPVTGGGDLSADRTIAVSAATPSAAGSLSGADKTIIDNTQTAIMVLGGGTHGTPSTTNTILGFNASSNNAAATGVGHTANVDANSATGIGASVIVTGVGSLGAGATASVTGASAVGMGYAATVANAAGQAYGREATTTAANQVVHGSAGYPVNSSRLVQGLNAQESQTNVSVELHTLALAATSDTAITIPANAMVKYVSIRITTAITGCVTLDVGVAGATTRYGTGLALTAGTTNPGPDIGGFPRYYTAATAIRFTAVGGGASFTAGVIRVTIHYESIVVPTS